ncbi:MAG: PilZ domain-containing protein [Beijerinckiaceae bacterium]
MKMDSHGEAKTPKTTLQRTSRRQTVKSPAVVTSEDGGETARIIVADISVNGARITFVDPPLTGAVLHFMGANGSIVRRGEVIWRKGDDAGVRFLA